MAAPADDTPRKDRPRAGLFVTCLVDVFRPSIGFAAADLIEHAGCDVVVPRAQTCCGQPAYNSGDRADTKAILANTIGAFADCDYVVVPSGSCAAMLKVHAPRLFADDPDMAGPARAFAAKVHELVTFLVRERKVVSVPGSYRGAVTYHDSCSGLRELGVKSEPRQLLTSINGLELVEMADCENCCGFGGTFSVKFPDISQAMVDKKSDAIAAAHVPLVLAGDLGCLMNMAGRLSRRREQVACRHIAEVLAGRLDTPPIASHGPAVE